MYGNRSVFATLPVSSVVPGAKASIVLSRPGRFTARSRDRHRCGHGHCSSGDQGSRDADPLLGSVQELPADGGAAGRLGAVAARREFPDCRQRRRGAAAGESAGDGACATGVDALARRRSRHVERRLAVTPFPQQPSRPGVRRPSALSDSAHLRSGDVFSASPLSAVTKARAARARDLSPRRRQASRPTSSCRCRRIRASSKR